MVAMPETYPRRGCGPTEAGARTATEPATWRRVRGTRVKSIPAHVTEDCMRLLRIGEPGAERPAVERDGRWFDARPVTEDIDGRFLGEGGIGRLRAAMDADRLPEVPREGVRIGAPVARPGKVVCIGLNYRDHAAETGA